MLKYRRTTASSSVFPLPDDVLLDIFDFYQSDHNYLVRPVWTWDVLVHVCRGWRQLVFASPQRLNLQILCTFGTPVRKTLGLWPRLPIVLDYPYLGSIELDGEQNVITALEHPDRLCSVTLNAIGRQLDEIATVMQKPLPVLTLLNISSSYTGPVSVLPVEFLGGSAPCLREITLLGVPFPALPTLLLSTSALVKLDIRNIPPTGHISPEAMVTSLAALPRLEIFAMGLHHAATLPNQICPPPVTRTVLPALTSFRFWGASGYLMDLVAQIDSPQLNRLHIQHLHWLVNFHDPQLSEFIDRSMGPRLTPLRCADLSICPRKVAFTLFCHANYPAWDQCHDLTISYEVWVDASHMSQVPNQFSAVLYNVVHLRLKYGVCQFERNTDDIEWPHLLRWFSAVQTLYVSCTHSRQVALALEDMTVGTVTEVLPTLDLIYLEAEQYQPAPSVKKFVATCWHSGHPVMVVDTETEFNEGLKSYITK